MQELTRPNPFLCRRTPFRPCVGIAPVCFPADDEGVPTSAEVVGKLLQEGKYLESLRLVQNNVTCAPLHTRTHHILLLANIELLLGFVESSECHFLEVYEFQSSEVDDHLLKGEAAEGLVKLWASHSNLCYLPGATTSLAVDQQRVISNLSIPGTVAGADPSHRHRPSYATKALELAHRNLLAKRRTFGETAPETGRAWLVLGIALMARAAGAQAGAAFNRAESIFNLLRETQFAQLSLVEIQVWQSRCQLLLGSVEKALLALHNAVDLARELVSPEHPLMEIVDVELGLVYERSLKYCMAEEVYNKALANNLANLSAQRIGDYSEHIFVLLRRVLGVQGKQDQVVETYKDELGLVPRTSSVTVAKLRQMLGFFRERSMSDSVKIAAQHLASAAAKVGDRVAERESLCAYAAVLHGEGNLVAAEALYREAGFCEKNPGPLTVLLELKKQARSVVAEPQSMVAGKQQMARQTEHSRTKSSSARKQRSRTTRDRDWSNFESTSSDLMLSNDFSDNSPNNTSLEIALPGLLLDGEMREVRSSVAT